MSELRRLKRLLDKAKGAKERHGFLNDIADYHYTNGNYGEALNFYEDELTAAIELQDKAKIAKAHRMIGEVNVQLNNYEEVLKHTKKYCEYACMNESNLEEQQQAYTTLGRAYMVYADSLPEKNDEFVKGHQLAKKALWKSLALCEKLEEKKFKMSSVADMRARSLLNLGVSCEGTNELDEAEKEYSLALRTCRKFHLEETLGLICYAYGSLLFRRRKLTEALKIYKEALSLTKSLSGKKQKDIITDIYSAKADVHILLGDVNTARKVLQKAFKRQGSTPDESVEGKLRNVAAIDLAQRKLRKTPGMSPEDKSKLYETIADGFSHLKLNEFALSNYEKMLECCKVADLNVDACFRSLAVTCQDLKQYDKAIYYFEQEILFCSPKEACVSLLMIHDCQLLNKAPISDQLNTLNRALSIAEEVNDSKSKRKTLIELKKLSRKCGSLDIKDIKQKLKDLGDYHSDEEDNDETQENTPNVGNYIDLELLSDYSEDEIEDDLGVKEDAQDTSRTLRPKRNPNRTNATAKWKNEKGETKLHVACQKGNIKSVQTLLEQGCDVNAVDHAGWTPLHEACNYGHLDVVELLLQYGADINFRSSMGGITPLSDAATNGSFEVIEFLLDHKASVSILTDEAETPYDILMSCYERHCDDLTPEQEQQFRCARDRLQACLDEVGITVGHSVKHSPDNCSSQRKMYRSHHKNVKWPSPNKSAGRLRRSVDNEDISVSSNKKRSMREISPISSSQSSPSKFSDECEVLDDEGKEGVSEYVSAMNNLRKTSEAPSETEIMRKPLEPLLPDDEVLEDWLEDDIGKQPTKKRKKLDQNTSCHRNNSYKPLAMKRNSSSRLSLNSRSSSRASSVSSTDVREDSRLSTGSTNSDVIDTPTPTNNWENECEEMQVCKENEGPHNFGDIWSDFSNSTTDDKRPNDTHHVRQSSLLSFGVTRQHVSQTSFSQVSQVPSHATVPAVLPSIVNVQVESHLLAVPVPNPSLSIGWLAEEAAKRYNKVDGCLPTLSIYSLEGALFSNDDPVSMVLGAHVKGHVQSWNVSSTSQRYQEACQLLSTEIDSNILSLLEAREGTQVLEIVDSLFQAHIMKPVFRAFSMESYLSKINFSNNALHDDGIMDLSDHLAKLSNLKELDLSGNCITAKGISYLATAAKKGYLKALLDLNLSHNNLSDASLPFFAELTVTIPRLQSLSLADCMFTKSIWDKSNHFLMLNNLLYLDLSCNQLHAKGIAGFLGFCDHNKERRLNPERLQTLRLVGLGGERLCQEVLLFLESADSIALRELHISYPAMQDEDLSQLLSVLRSAPEFQILRLPAAPKINAKTVCQLLLRDPPLKQLEIHNSKMMWKNARQEDIINAINYVASTSLEKLTLRDAPSALEEVWTARKGPSSVIKRGAFGLQMFLAQTSCLS